MLRMPLLFAVMLGLCTTVGAQNPPPPDNPEPDQQQPVQRQANPDPDQVGARQPRRQPSVKPIERTGTIGNPDATARTLGATGTDVPDLKLPKSFDVDYDDMFVDVNAECKGPVTWLVVSTSEKIKYKLAKEGDPVVTVGIPPRECVLSVFCVGFVDGHFTSWARTDITVHAQEPQPPPGPAPTPAPAPGPGPAPTPGPNTGPQVVPIPVGARLQYTVIEDVKARTYATKTIIESPTVRQAIGPTNIFRDRDVSDPVVASFVTFLQNHKVQLPALFVQINDGTRTPKPPLWYGPLPQTEAEMVALVTRLQGGR